MAVYQGEYGSMLVETRDGWQEMSIGENGYVDLRGTISAMPSGDYGGDYTATYATDVFYLIDNAVTYAIDGKDEG